MMKLDRNVYKVKIACLPLGLDMATPLHYMEFSHGQIIQESNEQELYSSFLAQL